MIDRMNALLVLGSFLIANIATFVYAALSAKGNWNVFLLPIVYFPIIYILDLAYSYAFVVGARSGYTVSLLLLVYIALYVVSLFIANALVWKEPVNPYQIVGVFLVVIGAGLILLKRS